MARKSSQHPTEKELEILNILWGQGRATVRQVNEEICKTVKTGYTTTLKLMQIMFEKGLLKRDSEGNRHVYRPAISQEETQSTLVGELLEKVFAGSAEKFVMSVLSAKQASPEELSSIKKIIKEMESK